MRAARVVGFGLAVVLAAGCGGDGGGTDPDPVIEVGATAAPCGDKLQPADPTAVLPADLPLLPGMTVYEKRPQGATTYYFGHVPGADVVAARDAARAAIESGTGYTGLESDAEPPAEAELAFEGTHEGSVQVIPLCAGHLRVRYKIVR